MSTGTYKNLNTGLTYDCVDVLKAKSDKNSKFLRLYNPSLSIMDNFKSKYEQNNNKDIYSHHNKRKTAMFRGVSIFKIPGFDTEAVLKNISKNLKKRLVGRYELKVICDNELVAYTPGDSSNLHHTMLKSDDFNPEECLNILKK